MYKFCFQPKDEFDEMLSPVDIGLDRFVDWRIEIYNAGQIHDNVNALELADLFRRDAAKGLIEISFDDLNLTPYDLFSAESIDDCAERRRLQDFRIKPLFARQRLFASGLNHQAIQFRKAFQNHRKQ